MKDFFYSKFLELKKILKIKDIECFLVLKAENILYLTGFYGPGSGSILIVTHDKCYFLVSSIYHLEAKDKINNKKIEIIKFQYNKYSQLLSIIKKIKEKKFTIEDSNLSYKAYTKIKENIIKEKKVLKTSKGIIEKLRIIKNKEELENIKKACNISDQAIQGIFKYKEKLYDYSEAEVALELEKIMVENGASGRSFDIIVANNDKASLPHHISGGERIKSGLILIDFGCKYNNYCSDITRTFFINNKKHHKIREIYDIVLQAQQLAIENCREGITCRELDRIAREYIEKKGYGENFGHGLGHGVGLEVHEGPILNSKSELELKENMVVTIEPGIYIEGIGGVRIEDMAVVKKGGCEILYTADKSYIDITE